jgi:hypothetical protein
MKKGNRKKKCYACLPSVLFFPILRTHAAELGGEARGYYSFAAKHATTSSQPRQASPSPPTPNLMLHRLVPILSTSIVMHEIARD